LLDRIGTNLLARREVLGRLLSREEGKILAEGHRRGDPSGLIFKFFAGEPCARSGEIVPPCEPASQNEVTRKPLGVIGLITPGISHGHPGMEVAPALEYGNCVRSQIGRTRAGVCHALAEIISERGPRRCFQSRDGESPVVGETLVTLRTRDGISFTGSVATGRTIAAKATRNG